MAAANYLLQISEQLCARHNARIRTRDIAIVADSFCFYPAALLRVPGAQLLTAVHLSGFASDLS